MIDWLVTQVDRIVQLLWLHAVLAVVATGIGLATALVAGSLIARTRRLAAWVVGASGVLFTIPSLVLIIFIPLVIGTRILDPVNIVAALSIYTFSLLLGGIVDGIRSVPAETVQAAEAMGFGRLRLLVGVELPLAIPVVGATLRVATVSNVSLVSVGALIGVGGLGDLFTEGFQRSYLVPIMWGIILSVLLAVILDLLIVGVERVMTPWTHVGGAR